MAVAATEDLLRSQLGPGYASVSSSTAARHAQMINEIVAKDDLRMDVESLGGNRFRITICASDTPGALATIAGLLTAKRASVESGSVFTVRVEAPVSPSPFRRWLPLGRARALKTRTVKRILDVFTVAIRGPVSPDYWDAFERELAALLALRRKKDPRAVRDALLDRIRGALSDAGAPTSLTPVQVDVDVDSDPERTIVDVQTVDAFGFFFEFTSGLELLQLDVDHADVRTEEGLIHDRFWVTDLRGAKIVDPGRVQEIRFGTALIQQFSQLLPHAPNPALAFAQFGEFTSELFSHPNWMEDVAALGAENVLRTLAEVFGQSQFLWQDFLRIQHENLFPVVANLPLLDRAVSRSDLSAELAGRIKAAAAVADKVREINAFKDREMFRIDLRHITGRIDFSQFGDELSDLAEVVLEESSALMEEILQKRYGRPRLADGSTCAWTGCVLGKLGGREMGFASDVEMIFVYEGDGRTDGSPRVDNTQYFEEFVADFLRTPKAARDGIFEIDLRLRPYGRAGNLASTLDAFRRFFSMEGEAEQYLRLALVKLRPVIGDEELGRRIVQARDAFVYSRQPLDWEDIRRLRRMQQEQLVAPGRFSAKHSAGGLVDLEYFVQATQIEAGSELASVRVPSTKQAIDRLREAGIFSDELAERLQTSYRFWRLMIDALRCVRGNSRDLTIPDEGTAEFAYLARRLRASSPSSLASQIDQHVAFCRERLDRRGAPIEPIRR
jgi:glutamate-ammonia-ligase adenylyltransferase